MKNKIGRLFKKKANAIKNLLKQPQLELHYDDNES